MKHLHQTRALLLGWGLLVFAPWSAAQVGFLAAMNLTSKTATTVSETAASEPKPEPITIPAGTHLHTAAPSIAARMIQMPRAPPLPCPRSAAQVNQKSKCLACATA